MIKSKNLADRSRRIPTLINCTSRAAITQTSGQGKGGTRQSSSSAKRLRRTRSYASAYAGMAESYAMLAYNAYLPPSDPKAIAAAKRAIDLDDDLAEAHAFDGSCSLMNGIGQPPTKNCGTPSN